MRVAGRTSSTLFLPITYESLSKTAMQLTLEVGVFAAASALAGRMLPVSLAAHQIALNLAGFTFMVPLGIASAGAVRVGHAVGCGDHAGAARAGWTALTLGALFMSVAALAFILIPRQLISATGIGATVPPRASANGELPGATSRHGTAAPISRIDST